MSSLKHKAGPITLFVLMQVASVAVLVLWIVWWAMGWQISNVIWLLQGILLMAWVIATSSIIFAHWGNVRSLDLERVNFLASISHELLTPVASLKLYTETLEMRDLSKEQQKEFLREMAADTDRLETLIRQILVASRIERSKDNYEFQNVELNEFIRQFFKDNQKLLKGGQVSLDLQTTAVVSIDEANFNLVLSNLVNNAVRYSPAKVELTVSLIEQGKHILLSISDHGQGIEAAQLQKIFKLFYRATKMTGGTGLGLYIVKNIVKAHHGKVWAESDGIGQGTTMKILLPKATIDRER